MSERIHPLAGQPAPASMLTNVEGLLAAYDDLQPDPSVATQRVAFGTSGHRGCSLNRGFNRHHVLAMSQAICDYRKGQGIDGPLFIGADTHALSQPALDTALEVLAANGVQTMLSTGGEYTPTPAVSHAILVHNRGRSSGLADGIVITPSHNPPDSGGFKYNATNGGPADTDVTGWVQNRANELLEGGLKDVRRMPLGEARQAANTHSHDYLSAYVDDLGSVIDFDLIRAAGLRLGVDPLGGAGVHYWSRIAERYGIDLDVVSETIDPQFAFMTLDWDGKIRMDPSSSNAMQRLIGLKDRYDIAFACDTDYDRHGIVAPSVGLLPANHFLSVSVDYLFQNRPQWSAGAAVGKTLVSSAMIDRVAARLGRPLVEVPVGFKWFVGGLVDGSLGFVGEESAGATILRRDGSVWTTDKDGIVMALLAAEMTARDGRDPGVRYRALTDEFGAIYADRVDAAADAEQKKALGKLTPERVRSSQLAGDAITAVFDKAPGNGAAIGGIKVASEGGWFAARPSGTEDIYKIYAESYRDEAHLQRILGEAQQIVDEALKG
ncbi:alpha-D-glucose phosphate-specific phosphoglucomutase [Stutzerimonas nosocomialis]|uniref:phosphoglucomutase (alpha-D-glucose-1,6-bisphosphate-dependent) n=1 Tax=Stutzerimonas nosocomialis TaxID=1056496 RepID=UPI001109A6E3|nr:phosphoglucomutase (alpha-D-glucose-1,6-bisphosphate-dependent) [Stutzerimonas nosocomialis]TLX55532.1 alpha-D-glucose phosphate-specific phosphoglucomutase [Stutzerimonas nosocomialis]